MKGRQAHPLREAAKVGRDGAQAAKAQERVRIQNEHTAAARKLVQLRREPAFGRPLAAHLPSGCKLGSRKFGLLYGLAGGPEQPISAFVTSAMQMHAEHCARTPA